jgi:phenylpropionate dioxygenase-like ring-hydroxylating dioxygenase large terminal subunit
MLRTRRSRVAVVTNPSRADRSPGPSARDIILGDSTPAPAPLLRESPVHLGTHPISMDAYTSTDFAVREHEHMWPRVWQWACREEHIPEPGDYEVYDIGPLSAIVVRGNDGKIRAFHNSCLHRGTQLKPAGTCGASQQLRCPYHGWTWSLEGTMTDLPCAWDFPDMDPATATLPQLQVGTWGGFVFVNWDPDAPLLESYLGALPEHFAEWDLADRYVEIHVRKRLPANWKAAQEAFLEAYHILETHPQSLPTAGDANAVYDIFDDHVSRFIHTGATPSPHLAEDQRPSEQEILELLLARKFPGAEVPTIPEGERARDVYARWMQREMGERYGHDFSGLSISETIDSIEYFLFPNAFFFPGLQFPMAYRFRPDGEDIDHSIFDLLILRPVPTDGPRPFPAEPFDLDVDDSYTTVPGIQQSLGAVYDQDTGNMAAQTRGFRSSATGQQNLGAYQESRTRQMHATLARYLAEGEAQMKGNNP